MARAAGGHADRAELETKQVRVCMGGGRKELRMTSVCGDKGEGSAEERGQGRQRKSPAGRAAISESRGNLLRQGILKGEQSGNGPRLCTGHTWCHLIKPAHMAAFHTESRGRGQSTVLPGYPAPKCSRRWHVGCLTLLRDKGRPPAPPLWSSQGRAPGSAFPPLLLIRACEGHSQGQPEPPDPAWMGQAVPGVKGRSEASRGTVRESLCACGGVTMGAGLYVMMLVVHGCLLFPWPLLSPQRARL